MSTEVHAPVVFTLYSLGGEGRSTILDDKYPITLIGNRPLTFQIYSVVTDVRTVNPEFLRQQSECFMLACLHMISFKYSTVLLHLKLEAALDVNKLHLNHFYYLAL